jgi:hypothetical protein
MIIETAVSVPYQMEPLLSGNRGAVTVEEGGALTVTELRRRFGCIFPGSVVQALVADDAGVG